MRRKSKRKYKGMENFSGILDNVLKKIDVKSHFLSHNFLLHCVEKLGKEFIKHMHPYSFKNGILFCLVDTPVWNQQYTFMKQQILERLNEEPCEIRITDIRFKVGSLNKSHYILGEEKSNDRYLALEKQVLNEEDIAFINNSIKNINHDLQECFRESLEVLIKYQKFRGVSEDGPG